MNVYLDYNATAPLLPAVREVMAEHLALPLNPSSVHRWGRKAGALVEASRRIVAEAVCTFPAEVFFCGSGTEANNWALRGVPQRRVLASAVEHASVLRHADALFPVNADGIADLAALEKMLAAEPVPVLVSLMLANNETGVIQPVAEVSALCRSHAALLHCDASQALGKIPIDCGMLGADMLTLSAHKFGGPAGAAALVVRGGVSLAPLLTGGGQENRQRAGTENVAAVAGFACAVQHLDFAGMGRMCRWLDEMTARIAEKSGGTSHWGGTWAHCVPCLPNTRMLLMPGVDSEMQLMQFDLAGIAVGAGSACASGRIEPSHVLSAMGMPPEAAKTAIRVSGGWGTTKAEIQAFTHTWLRIFHSLSLSCAA
ncbi:MAG: cysteine desulfurase [Alphaproteobacteria bacterium]|nr:cysteine desulfurase [Alphaproteobacteria bacterium]